jgi:hypothetical protein
MMSQSFEPADSPQKKRAGAAPASPMPSRILLVSYPKVVFLYPSLLVSLVAAIYLSFDQRPLDPANRAAVVLSVIFLAVLATNLVVLALDFPRTTLLALFFLVVAAVLGAVLLFVLRPEYLPYVAGTLRRFQPLANATFYWAFFIILGLVTLTAIFAARFDRWEARPNQLLHYKGLWGDLDRFPTPSLRVEKEINDVFEYLLLQSGRLILHIGNDRRAVVLENVLFIRKKEEALTRMLGKLHVAFRGDSGQG